MPVIINDFEVVVEEPPPPTEAHEPAPQPERLRPRDIDDIVQHFRVRRARLHAD